MSMLAILFLLVQQPAGTISGRVTDAVTHRPIRNALVTTTGGSRDISGDDGTFTVRQLTGVEVQVGAALAGYSTLEANSRFTDGDSLRLDQKPIPVVDGKFHADGIAPMTIGRNRSARKPGARAFPRCVGYLTATRF